MAAADADYRKQLDKIDDAVVRLRSDLDLERRDREAVEEEILGLLDGAVVGAGTSHLVLGPDAVAVRYDTMR